MPSLFTQAFLTALLLGSITAGVPLLLAGLGEQISEKAGVLNVGIEGMMLAGDLLGLPGRLRHRLDLARLRGGRWGGMLVASLMVLFCVRLGLSQIVIGIALTIGAEGLTALLHHYQFAQSYPRLPGVRPCRSRCCQRSRCSARRCSTGRRSSTLRLGW